MFAKHQVSTGMSALPSVDFNINNIHLSLVIVL